MSIMIRCFCIFLFFCLLGCGGDKEKNQSTQQTENGISNSSLNFENNKPVLFSYSNSVEGKLVSPLFIFSKDNINSQANIEIPLVNRAIEGNITLTLNNLSDEEGIEKVWIGFLGSSVANIVCMSVCEEVDEFFLTGINPRNFGQTSGELELQIWIEDKVGNVSIAKTQRLLWSPHAINISKIERSDDNLRVNWQDLSHIMRYNVYLSDQPLISTDQAFLSDSNQIALSLKNNSHTFSGLEKQKNYYLQITGIDGSGESAFSQSQLVRANEIIQPSAFNDNYEVEQNTVLVGNLLVNDLDNGLKPIIASVNAVVAPKHGELVITINGDFTYKPNFNFIGQDSFRYRIENSQGTLDEADVTITVLKTNTPPIALFNQFYVQKNTTLSTSGNLLLLNDIDFDGDELNINLAPIKTVSNGELLLNNSGDFTYKPSENFTGQDSFIYELEDGRGGKSSAEVLLTVIDEVVEPIHISVNDEYQLDEDEVVNIDTPGIFINDKGDDNSQWTLSIVQPVISGKLELMGSGAFRYFPKENYYGQDYFIYQMQNTAGFKSAAFVKIDIFPVNDPPYTQNDTVFTMPGIATSVAALQNDYDVDNDLINVSINILKNPENGIVYTNNELKLFVYTSNLGFEGQDYFTYQLVDINGGVSNISKVSVNVSKENNQPIANDDVVNTDQGESIEISILDNDIAVGHDIDKSSVKIVSEPKYGQISYSAETKSAIYIPNFNYFGTDSFTYSFKDLAGNVSNIASVSIVITKQNSPPIAADDNYKVQPNQSVTMNVLINDFDEDDIIDISSLIIQDEPNFGLLSFVSPGILEYTNTNSNTEFDVFTYQVSDGFGAVSNEAKVSIEIAAIQTKPIAQNDELSTYKNESVAFNILENDDFRGQALGDPPVIIMTQASNGVIEVLNQQGDIDYTPSFNFLGSDNFTYTAINALGEVSELATVTITINDKNFAPISEPAVVNITTDINDGDIITTIIASDPDGDALSYKILGSYSSIFSISNNGQVSVTNASTIKTNGTFDYTSEIEICDDKEPALCVISTLTVSVIETLNEHAIVNADFADDGIKNINLRASFEDHLVGEAITLPDGNIIIASAVGFFDINQNRDIYRAVLTKINSTGDIDTSFSETGVFDSDLGIRINELPQNVVAQNIVYDELDKYLYVTGYLDSGNAQDLILFRLTQSGILDKTFYSSGYFLLPSDAGYKATSVSLKLINNTLFILSNEQALNTYKGRVTRFDIDSETMTHSVYIPADDGSEGKGMVLLPDDKLVVFGNTQNSNSAINDSDIYLRKLNTSDLSDDFDFQNAGYVQIDIESAGLPNEVNFATLLSDSTLLLTGHHYTSFGSSTSLDQYTAYLMKLTLNGNFVTTFNNTGYRIYDVAEFPGTSESVNLHTFDASGVAVNEFETDLFLTVNRELYNDSKATQIMKLNSNGEIDTSWNETLRGFTYFNTDGLASNGTLSDLNNITLYGYNSDYEGYNFFRNQWFSKLSFNGQIDFNFGFQGLSFINSTVSKDYVTSSTKLPNGNILIAGQSHNYLNEVTPYVLSISENGKVDKSFGKYGIARLNLYGDAHLNKIISNDDNTSFIIGNEGESSVFVSKLSAQGLPDTHYGQGNLVKYFYASDFSFESLQISEIKADKNQEQITLIDADDGCVVKSLSLYLDSVGNLSEDKVYQPPAGYQCAQITRKFDALHINNEEVFAFGQDLISFTTPKVVVIKTKNKGILDETFGNSGVLDIDVGANPQNEIIFKGYVTDIDNNFYIYGRFDIYNFIVKLSTSGLVDTSFANNGTYLFSEYDTNQVDLKSIFLDGSSKLITISQSITANQVFISRLNLNNNPGSLDTTFSSVGYHALSSTINAKMISSQYHLDKNSFLLVFQDENKAQVIVYSIKIVKK